MTRTVTTALLLVLFLPSLAPAETPAQVLSAAQALVAEGDKGAAVALLAEALPGLSVGDGNADELLLWSAGTLRHDRSVLAIALSKIDAAQAQRLADAADGAGDWGLKRTMLERYRAAGGTNGARLLELGWAQAVTQRTSRGALATLSALAADEGTSGSIRTEAADCVTALTDPEALDSLEVLAQLMADRRAANAGTDLVEDAARRYAAACSRSFYTEMLADDQVSAGTKADHDAALAPMLYTARSFDACRLVSARLIGGVGHATGQYYEALSQYRLTHYADALEALWSFIEDNAEDERLPDALLHVALSLVATHEKALAFAEFELILDLYPETPAAQVAASYLSRWEQLPDFEALAAQAHAAVLARPSYQTAALGQVRQHRQAASAMTSVPGKTASAPAAPRPTTPAVTVSTSSAPSAPAAASSLATGTTVPPAHVPPAQ